MAGSPFAWQANTEPTAFVAERHYRTVKGRGISRSHQVMLSVRKVTKETGKNPGTIEGLGRDPGAEVRPTPQKRRRG